MLSLVGPGSTTAVVLSAAGRVVLSLLFALVASLVLLRFLPRLPFGRRLVLEPGLSTAEGYASRARERRTAGWARRAAPPRRCGRPASPRSMDSASTWFPTAT